MSTPLNSISIDCGAPIVWWLWNEGENLARIHCGTPFRCCKDPLHVCRAKRFLRCAVWIHSYSCGQKEPLTLSLYPPSRGRRFYMKGQGQQERWVSCGNFYIYRPTRRKDYIDVTPPHWSIFMKNSPKSSTGPLAFILNLRLRPCCCVFVRAWGGCATNMYVMHFANNLCGSHRFHYIIIKDGTESWDWVYT